MLSEKKWNKIGRHIKWGTEPILILAPRMKKVKELNYRTGEMEEKKKLWGFLAVPVYDISQTEGKPLPELNMPDMSGAEGLQFLEVMKDFCREHGIEATFKDMTGLGVHGVSHGGRIEIDERKPINQQVSTIIHEVAHEYMKHGESLRDYAKIPESMRETVAEGTAHVVLKQLGLPTKAAQYLAIYNVKKSDIRTWTEQISKTSHVIMSYLIQKTGWNLDQSMTVEDSAQEGGEQ
ncbi:MAG: hypothetical protein P1Q69_17860 [Candidatus Thorarchaeota archaeon]|nr:hypothetical protein [Candidatus Thorarchaeota archaeon]